MGASAGDLLSRDVAIKWLAGEGISYDVAAVPPFGDGLDWRKVDPSVYTHVVVVCGPCGNGPPLDEFLHTFRHCRLFGLNLSMLQPPGDWNPFEALFERDSTRAVRPDLSFLHPSASCPVAGLILIGRQPEYGRHDLNAFANQALTEALESQHVVAIPIDTCLEGNAGGLTTPAQVEALIARMDFVATTRLHGLVLSLKNGVPALAVDPVAGDAKISRQADALGWPAVIGVNQLSKERLTDLCTYCITAEARSKARECGGLAVRRLEGLHDEFLAALRRGPLSSD